jgi:hypothetical protein
MALNFNPNNHSFDGMTFDQRKAKSRELAETFLKSLDTGDGYLNYSELASHPDISPELAKGLLFLHGIKSGNRGVAIDQLVVNLNGYDNERTEAEDYDGVISDNKIEQLISWNNNRVEWADAFSDQPVNNYPRSSSTTSPEEQSTYEQSGEPAQQNTANQSQSNGLNFNPNNHSFDGMGRAGRTRKSKELAEAFLNNLDRNGGDGYLNYSELAAGEGITPELAKALMFVNGVKSGNDGVAIHKLVNNLWAYDKEQHGTGIANGEISDQRAAQLISSYSDDAEWENAFGVSTPALDNTVLQNNSTTATPVTNGDVATQSSTTGARNTSSITPQGDRYVPKDYLALVDNFMQLSDQQRLDADINYGVTKSDGSISAESANILAAIIATQPNDRPGLNTGNNGYMFDSSDTVTKEEFSQLGLNNKAWNTFFPGKTEVSQGEVAEVLIKLDKLDGQEDDIILANVKKRLNNGDNVLRSYIMSDNNQGNSPQVNGAANAEDAAVRFDNFVSQALGHDVTDDTKITADSDADIAKLLGKEGEPDIGTKFRQKYGENVNGQWVITYARLREVILEWDKSDQLEGGPEYDGIITQKHLDDNLPEQVLGERTPTAPPNGNSGNGSNGAGNTTTNTNPDPNDVYTTEEQRQQQAQQSSTQRRQQRQAPLTGMARVKQAVSQSILPAALATLLFVLLGQNKSQPAQTSYYQPPTWMPTYFGGIGNGFGNTNVFASQFNQQWGNGNMMNNFFA